MPEGEVGGGVGLGGASVAAEATTRRARRGGAEWGSKQSRAAVLKTGKGTPEGRVAAVAAIGGGCAEAEPSEAGTALWHG
jgi:hypothetical protein